MSWKEVTQMSQRKEFVNMALQENSNISELCRRFGISRKTGYKFIKRYLQEGEEGLKNHSRRPQKSPGKTSMQTERLILELREAHPAWGGRKLKRRLEDLGNQNIPSASTITAILQRNNCINPEESLKHKAWKRFRAEQPNDLWQMDFKGSFTLRDARCYPLTILDDHSRYSLRIKACTNQKKETVKKELITVFETYGLPYSILVDNGCPWGSDADHPHTRLTVWLMRLGVRVIHSRPFHPQTMGKDERFHRTLKTEVIAYCVNKTMNGCQIEFDNWRDIYNTERPHEALDMSVPSKFYQMSPRSYTTKLPELIYRSDDILRKVQDGGRISFRNKKHRVGRAFIGQLVAVRPTDIDGNYRVCFMNQNIAKISLE